MAGADMTRVREINEHVVSEALAIETRIAVDWLEVAKGNPAGTVSFDVRRFVAMQDDPLNFFAVDGSAPESLTLTLLEVLQFTHRLPDGRLLTGVDVDAFIRALFTTKYEAANPPA